MFFTKGSQQRSCLQRALPLLALVALSSVCCCIAATASPQPQQPTHLPGAGVFRELAQHAVASTQNGTALHTAAKLAEQAIDAAEVLAARAPEAGNFTANVASRFVQDALGPNSAADLYKRFCKGVGKTALVGASFVPTFLFPGVSNLGSCLLLACDVAANSYNGAMVELTGCLPVPMGKFVGLMASKAVGGNTYIGWLVKTAGRLVDVGPMVLRIVKRLLHLADSVDSTLGFFKKYT